MDAAKYGVIYGLARAAIVKFGSPYIAKLPFGQYNDEVAMSGLNLLATQFASGTIKEVAKTGLKAEIAIATANIASGYMGSTGSGSSDGVSYYG